MDFRRRSDNDAVGAAANDNHDTAAVAASGFTGFSDAQLTRLRRFYNDAAQTGSKRKSRGDDDGDDQQDETPTSSDAGQTPFTLASSAHVKRKSLSSIFAFILRRILSFLSKDAMLLPPAWSACFTRASIPITFVILLFAFRMR